MVSSLGLVTHVMHRIADEPIPYEDIRRVAGAAREVSEAFRQALRRVVIADV
jgi:hypothetical protein